MISEQQSSPDGAATVADRRDTSIGGGETPSPDAAHSTAVALRRRLLRWCRVNRRPIALTTLVFAAMALTGALVLVQYRPDRQIDDAAAREVLRAASDGAVASLSYSAESLDRDFAQAKTHLTGEFLAYYNKFTQQIVAPVVQQNHITQTAAVVQAAVSQLHPTSAVVLVFVNETAMSTDKPQPLITPRSIRVTLTKINGSWLISKLDPL
jgi:Mce-associated membrane protein